MDNFNLQKFLIENKITRNSRLLSEGIPGLIVVNEDGDKVIDPEVYEEVLRQEAKKRGVKLDEEKVEELIDELVNGGYGADEYTYVIPREILDDYIQWTTD
jgi:hypothetical protein